MISNESIVQLREHIQREGSKIVTVVLADRQIAGEIEEVTANGIVMTDGRTYNYEDIKEING
ncbi:hypothetical protein [Brevibacillus daliensis]|uniref:hypothetical protein n=1 Tax=Brevibacillus daliensis TaxID=2892995 RepID=UPI001E61E4C2|nr:hypothetical protein [Brevibacillus daliensis]